MSQLIVRRVPQRVVRALKQRALEAGWSTDAEHLAILEAALAVRTSARDFKAFLLTMPAVGPVQIRRSQDRGRAVKL